MSSERLFRENEGRFSQEENCASKPSPRSNNGNCLSNSANRIFSPSLVPSRPPHQVVTLAFLSGQIPSASISEHLARSLRAETEATVVLVRFQLLNDGGATLDGSHPDVSLNGEFHMPARMHQSEMGYYSVIVGVGTESPSPAGIASMVSQLRTHFQHVLIAAPANERSAPWLSECLLRSDLTYLFLRANTEDLRHYAELMREAPLPHHSIKLIGCLAEGEPTYGFESLVQRGPGPVHMFVRDCPTQADANQDGTQTALKNAFRTDVRRLAREVGGRLVGLALSSGAAKGFAHIGVIQVLEENGIEVDVVAGSSMGAYVGSLWAHGCDGREMERLARELEGRWPFWSLIDPVFPPRQGFLRGFAVRKRLMRTLGHERFADLTRPLRIVAGNLATLERVVFSSGEVAAAVHASCAVPGICVPVTIDGETYIDGGIVDPLPVDVLREMGVACVIAVDVIPTPDRIRAGLKAGREPARPTESGLRKLFRRMFSANQNLGYFARVNILEILMRSVYGAQIRVAEASARLADLVLRPNICDDRWIDYRNPGKFIALGREVAESHLEDIKALVARKELKHEQPSAPEPLATIA